MTGRKHDPRMRKIRALERIQLRAALLRDAIFADEVLQDAEDDPEREQSARRILVRTLVAWVEGDTNVRNDILIEEDGLRPVLSADAKRNLKHDRGPLKVRVRESLEAYMEMFEQFRPDFFTPEQESAWAEFDAAIKIRNRITHPKEQRDLVISDEEVALVRRVEASYDDMTDALFADEKG